MFIFFGWEIILITGSNFSCHGYRLYIFYVLHSLLEYPVVFTLRILIFANLMKKIFANIYFCEPVIGKVSPTFIFANQRKIYRILKICLPYFPLKPVGWMRIKLMDICQEKFPVLQGFFPDRGANVTHLYSTHYRRSPFFQEGLEIPGTIKVCFTASIKADMLIRKLKNKLKIYTSKQRMKLLSAVSSKRMIKTRMETRLASQWSEERKMFQK